MFSTLKQTDEKTLLAKRKQIFWMNPKYYLPLIFKQSNREVDNELWKDHLIRSSSGSEMTS